MLVRATTPGNLRHDPNHPKYKGDDSLTMPEGLSIDAFDSRRTLLAEIDRQRRGSMPTRSCVNSMHSSKPLATH